MISVRIFGGLGNQLFQYALGRQLSLKYKTGLLLDYYHQMIRSDFDGENLTKITDAFELPVRLYIGKIRKSLIHNRNLVYLDRLISYAYSKIRCVITEDDYDRFQERIPKCKNIYAIGYWQGEQYFSDVKDTIRNDFRFKIEEQVKHLDLYREIIDSNSVSLHLRGKDYFNTSFYSRCDVKYYMEAIDIISKANSKLKFFLFTDDINSVHQNYKELLKFSKIVNVHTPFKHDIVDLLLMSRCKHNIICNSSFSWWGAWLNNNPNKIVVSPRKWFNDEWINDPHYSDKDKVPVNWHKI